MDTSELGQIIRQHRKLSGLTRIECARLAGVGKTVVYDVEHGKPSVQLLTLLKILHVLNIRIRLSSPVINGSADDKTTEI